MKNIIYILALFVSFSSFGQDDIKQGESIGYYESGEVEFRRNWVDNLKQGEAIIYTINREIEEIKNYKDGQLIED